MNGRPPPEAARRTDFDRRHSISGAVALTLAHDFKQGTMWGAIFRNASAFGTFRALSGLPYTRQTQQGDGTTAPPGTVGRAVEPVNSSELPWTSVVDLRVNKGFRVGGLDLTAYLDVRNLLDRDNVIRLFTETGGVVNAKHREDFWINPELQGLANEAALAGAFDGDDGSVDLTGNCQAWGTPINCESLRRVEARFGDGDGVYTEDEQRRALRAGYDSFWGPWAMKDQGRHLRLGFEMRW